MDEDAVCAVGRLARLARGVIASPCSPCPLHRVVRRMQQRENGLHPKARFAVHLYESPVRCAGDQLRRSPFDRVIVEIEPVHLASNVCTARDRPEIPRDDLSDGHVVSTLHHATSHASGVDHWVGRPHEEEAHEITLTLGRSDKLHLVRRREHRLEREAPSRSRRSFAAPAAARTAAGEFQSPNSSRAMRSGLMYSHPPNHT